MNQSATEISLGFQHTYAEQLPEFYEAVEPADPRDPKLLMFNHALARELGFKVDELTDEVITQIFSGARVPKDARPIAQAYAGHQFGNFVPQLGDGRALLLGEVTGQDGVLRDVALKGSGQTPFSRGGDGMAAVGPVLREYVLGEAMHALGIPTTRALAAIATGGPVYREMALPGAVLTRVAASHVRVGTFQYFAARRQNENVRRLADYAIERHYPEIADDEAAYLKLLRCVVERQANLVARWLLVGFIHGVMNTDNMAISGETIDYGPCAFLETYDPSTVFSSIDRTGRYAFGNQPSIALWNLARFAETLLPLLNDDIENAIEEAKSILDTFMPTFERHLYAGARTKLGIGSIGVTRLVSEPERELIDDWFAMLLKQKVDYTLAWRSLADAAEGDESKLRARFEDQNELNVWLESWSRCRGETEPSIMAADIRATNPLYIPRNHLVEEALSAATDEGDLAPFIRLLEAVKQPFESKPELSKYAMPAPPEFTACYQTFCGT